MLQKYHVYLWEPETSPHKLPLLRELLGHPRISGASYIAQSNLNEHRRLEGWDDEAGGALPVIIAPTPEQIETIVAESAADSIHIFSGMHWVPTIVNGLGAVVKHKRRFGLMHEPRVLEGVRGLGRLGHSWLTEAPLRRNASFVLAIGAHGPRWFRLTGFPAKRIFPFAYFLSKPVVSGASFNVAASAEPVVTFLGRLEELKGIHLFLSALGKITSKAKFYVAGFGTWSARVEDAQRTHSNLQFLGAIKMAEVPYLLSNTDILVLPSITMDDGWGAVISEALMAGAAVVSSHKVGASMCLSDPTRGRVVDKLSGADVAKAVDEIIGNGLLNGSYRQARAEWADEHLTQRAGVEYLLRIFDHVFDGRPRPKSFVGEHD